SHALALERVAAVRFQAAVFTNLTRDHLDFHKDMDEYGAAKARLFTLLKSDGVGILNADDPAYRIMQAACASRCVTVGSRGDRLDYRVGFLEASSGDSRFMIEGRGVKEIFRTPLWGHFNILNAACAAVTGLKMGVDPESIRKGLAGVKRVPGRMEGILSNLGFRVVVDYAHSPDALENVLTACRGFTAGRLIAVFGCGGDRDRGKRPAMGRVAARLADLVFVTSDNPRTEGPEAIIRDILEGIPAGTNYRVEADRASAIRLALGEARSGDTVVLAGKGHEPYQEVNGVKHPFDDREVAGKVLREMGGQAACG
ncbi:UDP-N-acetylmuramoyl-L-alanyl-D-glutamate--2,6-diaminopimelate ligase, partial [bacterium]|nr:UDP-N-acetylmuramoyl-L-alanyl-D-glutamate--2,6-diaminopimelate ligase [bacterium]